MSAANPDPMRQPAPSAAWLALGGLGLAIAYALVFSLTGNGPVQALGWAAANVLPAAGLAWGAEQILRRRVMGRTPVVQALAHVALALSFVALWYGALIPALATVQWTLGGGFRLTPLTGPALPWQLFQGLMIYCVVAAMAHALARPEVARAPVVVDRMDRYLMRQGDDIRPVDVASIISIRGADDYSEVFTTRGAHLARVTLKTFEARLDPAKFLRVHRSRMINLDHLVRAEPAGGGRLLVHMSDGQTFTVSRAGARALRDRVV